MKYDRLKSAMAGHAEFSGYYLSEEAVSLVFGETIDESVQNCISQVDQILQSHPFPGFIGTVPAYTTLTIYFIPWVLLGSGIGGYDCFAKITNYVKNALKDFNKACTVKSRIIHIPVCYHKEVAPDLEELAEFHKLPVNAVIKRHLAPVYRVSMIGFVPGFAYLAGLDQQLATPRKQLPRTVVPAGSVGIAGEQTGIYPFATPGGWQLIGRTPLQMFNAENDPPSLLRAGDRVIFKEIDQHVFFALSK